MAFAIICNGIAMANMPRANPYLAAESISIAHVDSAQSDSFTYSLPKGNFNIDLNITPEVAGGPICIMTLRSTSPDYMWSVSSGGVAYVHMADASWQEVARAGFPNVQYFSAEFNKDALSKPFTTEKQIEDVVKKIYKVNSMERISNGIYSLVDNNNILYASAGKMVYAFSLIDPDSPEKGINILRSYDMNKINKKLMDDSETLFVDIHQNRQKNSCELLFKELCTVSPIVLTPSTFATTLARSSAYTLVARQLQYLLNNVPYDHI